MLNASLLLLSAVISLGPTRHDVARADVRLEKSIDREMIDISGYYSCSGEDAQGTRYSGITIITKKNDVYLVQWTIGLGANFVGIGIRQGDTLAVSWATSGEKGLVRGVNLYRISAGPRLSGTWATLPGNGTTRTENLTFLRKLGEE